MSQVLKDMLGSPRKPQISLPENPVHLTHVGYDNSTGEFTVRCNAFIALRQTFRKHMRILTLHALT